MKNIIKKINFNFSLLRFWLDYNNEIINSFFDRFLWHHKIINSKKWKPVYSSMVPPLFSKASANLFWNSLFDAFFDKNSLYEVNVALWDKCNAKCSHCSFFDSIYSSNWKILNTKQYIDIIKDIQKHWAKNIVFVWWEPLMYDWIFDIIKSINKDKSVSTIFTNWYYLEENIEKLYNAWLDSIAISIDNYNLKVHDLKRWLKWLSDKIISWIKKAQKYDFNLIMSIYLYQEDYWELSKYMELAKQLWFHEVIIFPAFPAWKLKDKKIKPSDESFLNLKVIIDSYNEKLDYPWIYWYSWISSNYSIWCQWGKKYFYISPYWDVLHCDFKNLSYWNIVENSLESIMLNMSKSKNNCSWCIAFL